MTGEEEIKLIDEAGADPFSLAIIRSARSLEKVSELLPQLITATERLVQSYESFPASEDQLKYLSELSGLRVIDLRKENFTRAEASRLIKQEIKGKKLEEL